jgi:hypothetical protein
MALKYQNLDGLTRAKMLGEVASDIAQNNLYISPRLNDSGREDWALLLRQAIEESDDDWLAKEITARKLLNAHVEQKQGGKIVKMKMPANAANALAEVEFNRFYIRGLCARAISKGLEGVIVYLGRQGQALRPESEKLIGSTLNPSVLLEDLRKNKEKSPELLPDVNFGLTVRLP